MSDPVKAALPEHWAEFRIDAHGTDIGTVMLVFHQGQIQTIVHVPLSEVHSLVGANGDATRQCMERTIAKKKEPVR